jgi:hypothetical protein
MPQAHDLCIFTWSSDHTVDACRWRAQQLLGALALRPLKRVHSWVRRPRATVGILDTKVSQSTCSWASSMAQLRPRGEMMTEAIGEDPHKEAPHEENDNQNY